MSFSARRFLASIVVVILAMQTSAAMSATVVGINFIGGGGPLNSSVSLAPGDVAGVVPQGNFNNIAGNAGAVNDLNDGTGAATTIDLTFSGAGVYTSSGSTPAGADERLNSGFVYGTTTGTVSQIPFQTYDVYIYLENDAGGRLTTTTLNGSNVREHTSVSGGSAGQVDGNAGTPFVYLLAGNAGNTAAGNYALFSGISGSSFTFSTSAPGNGSISGIQIVDTTILPEPATIAIWSMLGLGFAGFAYRRFRLR